MRNRIRKEWWVTWIEGIILILGCWLAAKPADAQVATYKVPGLSFQYPVSDWWVEPGYGLGANKLHQIAGETTIVFAFSSYASDPDLNKTVDAFLYMNKYSKGYVPLSRTTFLTGIRTEHVYQPRRGRPTVVVQYFFNKGGNTFVIIIAECPVIVRDTYGPVFDKIARAIK